MDLQSFYQKAADFLCALDADLSAAGISIPPHWDVVHSDLDILLKAQDLQQLESELRHHYENRTFTCQVLDVDGLPTLSAQFIWDQVPFEIFAQDRDTVLQRAYRHFQTEEKYLKKGGERLRQKIVELRLQGLKTEPAFARALGLSGDPYEALLEFKEL